MNKSVIEQQPTISIEREPDCETQISIRGGWLPNLPSRIASQGCTVREHLKMRPVRTVSNSRMTLVLHEADYIIGGEHVSMAVEMISTDREYRIVFLYHDLNTAMIESGLGDVTSYEESRFGDFLQYCESMAYRWFAIKGK